jgi:hypothetical protein
MGARQVAKTLARAAPNVENVADVEMQFLAARVVRQCGRGHAVKAGIVARAIARSENDRT